jgi:protein-S-isoprenylcysteine O-methyltransferase Ste14
MASVLEHRIPPPIIFLLTGVAMWLTARMAPGLDLTQTLRLVFALPFAALGVLTSVLGLTAFGQAKTTVNPVRIETASSLVTSGVYHFSRNPMYLGLTLLLVAWALYLAAPLAFLWPAIFVLYITWFQIIPEERTLRLLFGTSYDEYCARVRRWL